MGGEGRRRLSRSRTGSARCSFTPSTNGSGAKSLPRSQPFNERSKDDFYASATQRIGDHWQLSASYTHAGASPGNPAMLSVNNALLAPAATVQANQFSDAANQYSAGVRYWFTNWASVYLVGTYLTQGMGAHYCLGASGHGYQICSRDAVQRHDRRRDDQGSIDRHDAGLLNVGRRQRNPYRRGLASAGLFILHLPGAGWRLPPSLWRRPGVGDLFAGKGVGIHVPGIAQLATVRTPACRWRRSRKPAVPFARRRRAAPVAGRPRSRSIAESLPDSVSKVASINKPGLMAGLHRLHRVILVRRPVAAILDTGGISHCRYRPGPRPNNGQNNRQLQYLSAASTRESGPTARDRPAIRRSARTSQGRAAGRGRAAVSPSLRRRTEPCRQLHRLGVVAHQLGRPDAVELLKRAVTLQPDVAEAHNDLGNVLGAQGKFVQAAACFERAGDAQAGLRRRPLQSRPGARQSRPVRRGGRMFPAGACAQSAIGLAHVHLGNALRAQAQARGRRGALSARRGADAGFGGRAQQSRQCADGARPGRRGASRISTGRSRSPPISRRRITIAALRCAA